MTAEIESLLKRAQCVFYETGNEDFPYAMGGTCFPVRFNHHFFILTALHCSKNHNYDPIKTGYNPNYDDVTLLTYDAKVWGGNQDTEKYKNEDFVFLKVAQSIHTTQYLDNIKALDISQNKNCATLSSKENIIDLHARGFPAELSKGIDYESCKISTRAYWTNGFEYISNSNWKGCYFVRFITPKPEIINIPSGMSGAPVYAIKKDGAIGLAGMIIEYRSLDNTYLILGIEVLQSALIMKYGTQH